MSQQAFNRLMSQLPEEDKKKIYAAAAAYNLSWDDPEWIPFAISQHGLLSIQKATRELEDALKRGSAHAVAEAMKAIAALKTAEQTALQQASQNGREAVVAQATQGGKDIAAAARKAQESLVSNITEQIGWTTRDIVNSEIEALHQAAGALTTAIQEAKNQVGEIKDVKTTHVVMWALAAGMAGALFMASFMFVAMRLGWVEITADKARIPQITLDGNQVGRIIIDEMRHRGR